MTGAARCQLASYAGRCRQRGSQVQALAEQRLAACQVSRTKQHAPAVHSKVLCYALRSTMPQHCSAKPGSWTS